MTKTDYIPILVRRLQQGKIEAFNQLFDCYSSRLYHFAYGYLKSKEEAEELTQEIFTRIWEKRAELKPEQQFESYLFTIAFNEIKKHFRAQVIANKYVEYHKIVSDSEQVTSPDVQFRALQDHVNELIEQMPSRRKAVFIKSRIEGKKISEIADELEISLKTAENHLHSALKFLRKELSREQIIGLLFFYIFLF